MDYSAASQAAKRFEQESKVNTKIRDINQKMMPGLRENWMYNIEVRPQNYFIKKVFKVKISSPDKMVVI